MTAAPTSTPTTPTPSPRTDVVVATRYRFLELSEKVENENTVNHMHASISMPIYSAILGLLGAKMRSKSKNIDFPLGV